MDYLLPLWLRQYLIQRQKRGMSEIPEDVADHLLHICAQALNQRDPVTLSQPRAHSIHQSFVLILRQPTLTSLSATRSKFPFASSSSAYKTLKPRDLDPLKSQEVVRMAIYIMKRSRLEFADPFTCERVHTEGEKFLKHRTRGHADPTSQQMPGEATAAQVYLTSDFHIGNSVLHNRSYPIPCHVESLITIAAFCARASALRRRPRTEGTSTGLVSPTASALDMASASIAGSKWLAKLGQIMFGGVCAQAGHTHHRRTRASLELLEQQNVELGQKMLAEQQHQQRQQKRQGQPSSPISKSLAAADSGLPSPASVTEVAKPSELGLSSSSSILLRSPGLGSLSHSTSTSALSLSVVSTGTTNLGATSTSTSTSIGTPLQDKWCKHCSRAMSCLVIIAVQESNRALVGAEDLGVSLEDPGFGNMSSFAMDTLNAIHSLSSSASSLNDSPVDRRAHMYRASDRSRRKHDASSSPHILLDRSHDHDDDMVHSRTVPAVKASSTLSESLADAFGSELASAGTSDKYPTSGDSSSSGSSGRSSSNNNRIKKIITAGLQRSTTDESDLELISRTGSGLPSTGMSMESSFTASTRAESWQNTSPAVQESRSQDQSRNSPRPIPTRTSSGTMQSSRARLEMDLAEAAATPSPGSVSSFSSLPATAIGIHPTLESFASTPGARRRSQVSSRRLSAEEGMEKDAATARSDMVLEEETKGASPSTGPSHSPSSPTESTSQSLSRSPSPTRLQSSASLTSAADSQRDISISSTPSLPSPSHSAAVREVPEQGVKDYEEEERSAPERHSFYALGIHGQTTTESYAREIEESMSRAPPLDSSRSSLSSSLGARALEQSNSDTQGASVPVASSHDDDDDDDDDDEDDEDDATEYADEQRETAAARHPGKEDSGSRETKLGSDSESEDKTSLPLAPPSKVSAQGSPELEGEQDDNDESESEIENENESMKESESENSIEHHQENTSSSSLATRPLSTASSSTLLTDDSFLSSLGSSSSIHDHGHGDEGDEDDDGEDSPRLDSSFTLSGPDRQPLTREERKQEQQRLKRRKRRLLVDDAKRKQEQLDRIKAQLELKDLGKIRQQVSFWEEKGILEQKVVAMVEVEEEPEEAEGPPQSKDEVSSPGNHRSADDLRALERQEEKEDASPPDKTVVIQDKMADFTLGEPLSPGNNQLSGYDEPPKPAARKQAATDQMAASVLCESDLAVFLSDVD